MMKIKLYVFYFFLFFATPFSQTPLDGIIAVVGSRPILHSDVLQQTQVVALQQNVDFSKSPLRFEVIYKQVLSDMIDQYVVLSAAETDTNIVVADAEVDLALENQISDLIGRAGSEAALEVALGSSIRKIKKDYWPEIRNMMLIDRFRFSLVADVSVSRPEVVGFFDAFGGSIPVVQKRVKFSVIEIPVVPGPESIAVAERYIEEIRQKIILGESFSQLAKEFSEDPGSAPGGGDLGFMKRGTLVKEYEEVAFSLKPGELSPPIRTSFGFHLIELLEKRGEKVHTRHILKKIGPSVKDKEVVLSQMRDIYNNSENDPGLFDSLAAVFRSEFNNLSGEYPLTEEEHLPLPLLEQINATEKYTLSYPFESSKNSVILVYVNEKKAASKPTLENAWNSISEMAKNDKMNKKVITWIDKERLKTYIKIYGQ